jgi:phosphoribosylformylglycinamidine synthase
MWQLSEAIDGMSDACVSFGVPVIGGNVSLYNESEGNNIAPTPVIGMLGLIDDLKNRPPGAQMAEGDRLLLIGPETSGLGGSLWAANHGALYGELPELDLEMHLKVAETIRTLVKTELIRGVHDLSEGGLGVALAEMAAKSSVGVSIARTPNHQALFGEGPSRAVVAVDPESLTEVLTLCEERGVPVVRLGLATGNQFKIKDMMDVSLSDLKAAFISKLPNTFGVGTSNQ